MNTQVYEIITERVLSLLNSGVCPWRMPWNRLNLTPRNFATGREYNGINFLLLSAMGYEVPLFLTFKQVIERRGAVRKGSKGFPVVFWKTFDAPAQSEDEEARRIPFLRYYTVFNASQIDGIAFPEVPSRTGQSFTPVDAAEKIVAGWEGGPRIAHGFNRACYVSTTDEIRMPGPASFDSREEYYSTLFHEMGHATGAVHRLNREKGRRFGDDAYSREELVAEMTAAFLCARCGIDNDVIANQAAYLDGWVRALEADARLIVIAASQAQKAAGLILGDLKPAEPTETTTSAA